MPMPRERRVGVLLMVAAVVAGVAFGGGAALLSRDSDAAPAAPGAAAVSLPTFDYGRAVREHLLVQTDLDNDADGVPDQIAIDVVRPSPTQLSGATVPVILQSSPYYYTLGRGPQGELKQADTTGTVTGMPLYYDNYFVPRGYAFVAMDNPGTGKSTGCMDLWGPEDTQAAVAVVEFLTGKRTALDASGQTVTAGWSSGSVGMIGKSYDATVANAVAATGVEGLKTVVSVSGIIDPYAYTRFNGIVRSADYERWYVRSQTSRAAACTKVTDAMPVAADDAGGSRTAFWAERDIRPKVDATTASVLVTHGLTDWNVLSSQAATYWQGLGEAGVPRKLWLSQAGHVDPFDLRRQEWVDTLHRWLDRWLLGVPNGIEDEPPVTVEAADGSWVDQSAWPAAEAAARTYRFGAAGQLGGLGADPPPGGVQDLVDDKDQDTDTALSDPAATTASRLAYLTEPLATGVHLSGSATLTLRVKAQAPRAQVSVKLVDYGTASRIDASKDEGITLSGPLQCFGSSTAGDDACYDSATVTARPSAYGILARGWLDLGHRDSLTTPQGFGPDEWLTVSITLTPTDLEVPAGHQLGLVVTGSDPDLALPYPEPATYQLDPAGSTLVLPVVGA